MIAAGEVVEGPFSAVKELVENSLDAGAGEVDVQVWDSGLKRILVRDNGHGIHSSDIRLAIMEHATSKISDSSGLERIITYGFRGEALSSISSISDLVIISRRSDEETGARLESSGGSVNVSEYMGTPGTTVIVENLFNNVPARKKFLKAKKTELKNIRETILRTSVPAYGTGFTFDVDGKRQITLPAASSLEERVKQVFGRTILDDLYYEELKDLKVSISGFLSKPGFVKNTRSMQFLFINGRPVEYRYFQYHLSRAYEAVIPGGKYPAAIIFLDIDPELTDVNVHPAKREVRLFDQKYIDELVYGLARKALNRIHSVPLPDPSENGKSDFLPLNDFSASQAQNSTLIMAGDRSGNDLSGTLFSEPIPAERVTFVSEPVTGEDIKVLGVIFDTYLVAEKGESMYLVDFHAAHERIIYDRIISSDYEPESQELLFPVTVELPVADYASAVENLNIFESAGFEIEDFSDNTIVVRSVPAIAGRDNIEVLIKNMIANIREEKNSNNLRERFMSTLACHSARRSGDTLHGTELSYLATAVFGMQELRCPHGRPFIYELSKNDIERMFKRL